MAEGSMLVTPLAYLRSRQTQNCKPAERHQLAVPGFEGPARFAVWAAFPARPERLDQVQWARAADTKCRANEPGPTGGRHRGRRAAAGGSAPFRASRGR